LQGHRADGGNGADPELFCTLQALIL
jgi:hypothetical protein